MTEEQAIERIATAIKGYGLIEPETDYAATWLAKAAWNEMKAIMREDGERSRAQTAGMMPQTTIAQALSDVPSNSMGSEIAQALGRGDDSSQHDETTRATR